LIDDDGHARGNAIGDWLDRIRLLMLVSF